MNHQPSQQQQQQTGKMSASPPLLLQPPPPEPDEGFVMGRQRKLESMIRDPRSPVNVESLLVSLRRDSPGGGFREREEKPGRGGGADERLFYLEGAKG